MDICLKLLKGYFSITVELPKYHISIGVKTMQRIEFDKLEIIEQLNYINKELKTGMLAAICKSIGVGRTTMSDRV